MRRQWIWLFWMTAVAVGGTLLVLTVTRWGAFVSDDSYHYIKPVRDALAGLGFHPSPIFPPGLPVALLPLGWLGIDPLVGIRWLNAFLFGANALLAGVMVKRMGASNTFALLAALWVAWAEPALEAHAGAMSEALSITFTLLALLVALAYLETPRWRTLIASALLASLACLTRYAALPVVVAIPIALVFFHTRHRWKERLAAPAVFAAVSLLPVAVYVQRSAIVLGRPLYYPSYTSEPFTRDNLVWYLYNTLDWFVPGRFLGGHELSAGLVALFVLILCSVAWRFFRRRNPGIPLRISPGLWLLVLYVLMTYVLLYFSRGLTHLVIYNPRYLVPPLLAVLLVFVYLLDRFWRFCGRWPRKAIVMLCIGFSLYYGYRTAEYTWRISQTGLGYLNIGWHTSETIPYLKQNPDRTVVATGDVGIYFWTGRLPRVVTAFGSMEAMRTFLCDNNGILVIMSQMPTEIYRLDEGDVVRGLELEREFNDSRVYGCPSSQ